MATSSNCAQPGTSGVDFGASYSYQGATYDCVAGSGLEIGPFANGLPCKSWHDCTSHYCYPGPDQTYCIAATANCAQPGTSGAQFGTSYTYEGSKYDCVAGQGLEAPPFTNGAPCQQDSDCGSNTCAAGPDQSYCIAASANCAQPGTSGVQYGASYVYQGATYDCIAGTGLETGPFADGLPCKSSYDCSSHYCYPGPDQMYCISESANCAQPGTSGVQFGTSYSYNGSTYDCIAGEGLQGGPFANGSPCEQNGDCTSGSCSPGPGQSYCIATTANCAQPGTSGVQYGSSYVYDSVTYDCVAGTGLETGPFADGLPCNSYSDCASHYCYPGPDQSYCIAATASCAEPGTAGAGFGASYSFDGTTYDCVRGQGLLAAPFSNGLPCQSSSDCTSADCEPGPDQNYCLATSSNCAQPGTSGVQFGASYAYQGTTYDCVAGSGLEAPPFANGIACRYHSDCSSNYCYPGPDQYYCIAASANCAQPGTSGVQFGQGYVYDSVEYTCASGQGLETCIPQSCSQLGLNCAGTDNCGAPIQCGSCTEPETCGGGGQQGVCGGGPQLVTLDSTAINPEQIAVDATNVYFTTDYGASSYVIQVPINGGTPIQLATCDQCMSVTVDATNVYWTTAQGGSGTVNMVTIGGGTPLQLAVGKSPYGIAVDATSVYWTDSTLGTVNKIPIGGGTITTLVTGQTIPYSLAVDSSNVYWINYTSAGAVMKATKVPVDGGSPTKLASASSPTSLAIDSNNVYWTALSPSSSLASVPIAGGTPTVLAANQAQANGIAVDSSNVYWTDNSGELVQSIPIGGGTITQLESGQAGPTGIAVDATSLYWANNGGTVMKLTPK